MEIPAQARAYFSSIMPLNHVHPWHFSTPHLCCWNIFMPVFEMLLSLPPLIVAFVSTFLSTITDLFTHPNSHLLYLVFDNALSLYEICFLWEMSLIPCFAMVYHSKTWFCFGMPKEECEKKVFLRMPLSDIDSIQLKS